MIGTHETLETYGFRLRPAGECWTDILGCGAMGIRLSSEQTPLQEATSLEMFGPTGAEFNPVANAAYTFGLRAAFCTALVEIKAGENHPLADWIEQGMRRVGVQGIFKKYIDNGRGNPSHALVLSDKGFGERGPEVFYYRAVEAGRLLKPGDFDWNHYFSLDRSARWAHSGGLFAALSPTTAELIIEMAQAAAKHSVPFSFDINWRPKLWMDIGGLDFAQEVYAKILPNVTAGFGNESDWADATGLRKPEHPAGEGINVEAYKEFISQVAVLYPNLKIIGTSLRDMVDSNHHRWSALLYVNGQFYSAPWMDITVLDRVGGGDGFLGGVVSAILMGMPPQAAVLWGWALGAHVACSHGDMSQVKARHVMKTVASAGSAEAKRIDR